MERSPAKRLYIIDRRSTNEIEADFIDHQRHAVQLGREVVRLDAVG